MKIVYGDMSFAEMEHLLDGKVLMKVSTEFGDTALHMQIEKAVSNFCNESDSSMFILINNMNVLLDVFDGVKEEGGEDLLKGNVFGFTPQEKRFSRMNVSTKDNSFMELFNKIINGK